MARSNFGRIDKWRTKNGKIRYRARYLDFNHPYRSDGKPNLIVLGTFGTKGDAQWALNEQQLSWEKECSHQEKPEEKILFGDFAEEFLLSRNWAGETQRVEQYRLNKHILPYWKDLFLDEITKKDVAKWINRVVPRQTPAARIKAFELLRAMFNYAVEMEYIEKNPCKKIRIQDPDGENVEKKKRIIAAITREELEKLVQAIEPKYRLLTHLCGLSGLRLGEARNLHGYSINKDEKGQVWINVKGTYSGHGNMTSINVKGKTKNAIRRIPAYPSIAEQLYRQARKVGDESYLFPSTKTTKNLPFSDADYRRALARGCEKAGIRRITPHELRHTAVSLIAATDVPRFYAQYMIGHQDSKMFDHYSHVYEENLVALVRQVDKKAAP